MSVEHERPGPQRLHWRSAERDRGMQEEHGFLWAALLETAAVDLTGRRVLDVGCNQGGFLRLVADRYGIAEARGYDPAAGAVEVAKRLAGRRAIEYVVADTVPPQWTDFDVAFSHEVLYLLHDLPGHASALRRALRAGGCYFAAMGTHDRNPLMLRWHRELARSMNVPPVYSLDEVARVFLEAGFSVSISRLKIGFVPVTAPAVPDPAIPAPASPDLASPDLASPDLAAILSYYYDDKYLFRFVVE